MPVTVGDILDALADRPRDEVVLVPASGSAGLYASLVGVVRPVSVYPHAGGRHLFTTDAARAADLMAEPVAAVEIS